MSSFRLISPETGLVRKLQRVPDPFHQDQGGGIPRGLTRPGLIVLDLMRLFCDSASPAFLPAYPKIEKKLFELVDAMTKSGRPVLFTRHAHGDGDDGGLFGRMYSRLQKAGDPLNELIASAKRRMPPAVERAKNRYSPFYDESAARIFEACDSLLIAGVQTHACVLATAVDCSRLGIVPLVVADACASKSERLHREAVNVLASGHAYVLSGDEAIAAFFPGRKAE